MIRIYTYWPGHENEPEIDLVDNQEARELVAEFRAAGARVETQHVNAENDPECFVNMFH